MSALPSRLPAWEALAAHVKEIEQLHLKDLVQDKARYASLTAEYDNMFLDFSRQRVTPRTLSLLFDLAEQSALFPKIKALFAGERLNKTESRAALHVALRASANQVYQVDGENVVPAVIRVRNQINLFSEAVRSGKQVGHSFYPIQNVVAIGIGGSYLGANFVYEALRHDPEAAAAAKGRELRFLANVDPVAVSRALEGLKPEETMAIVISKTFTTRETMLNARTVRKWFVDKLGKDSVAKHMVAVSTNLKAVEEFGINPANAFEFWDWVGGRYSVTSAVGLLPLTLHYGQAVVEKFIQGCRSLDTNFLNAQPRENLAVLLGLLGVWNSTFLGFHSRALICYGEAMLKLAPHIQQVDMESNGKRVTLDGTPVDYSVGEVDFGEPGTNSQHSFFQLIHQGQVVPVDFVGFAESQTPVALPGEDVANHDELMANFFAQPDALASGKSEAELKAEGMDATLIPHRTFPGNRPSNVLLLPRLTAYEVGQILALYEHRTVVQGFIWHINSFDQWGVELGKKLADQVRKQLGALRADGSAPVSAHFNPSTQALLSRYVGAAKAPAKL